MVELYAPIGADDPADEQIAPDETVGAAGDDEPRMMNVIDPPVQRDGFVEQKIHTYEIKDDEPGKSAVDGSVEITTRPANPGASPNTRAG